MINRFLAGIRNNFLEFLNPLFLYENQVINRLSSREEIEEPREEIEEPREEIEGA